MYNQQLTKEASHMDLLRHTAIFGKNKGGFFTFLIILFKHNNFI